jgi:ketosteroid isomerase-like protein
MTFRYSIRLLVAGVLVAATAGVATAQSMTAAQREVLAVVQQLADAQRTFDQQLLDQVLAADYLEVSPVGDVDDRAKVIGSYGPEAKAKAPPVSAIALDEPSIRITGDHALVIVKQTVTMEAGGTSRTIMMRVTASLRKIGGRWRISSTQYTGMRPPQKG